MQMTVSVFTDPANRPGLEQYYEAMKADLYERLKEREQRSLPDEVNFDRGDGVTETATLIPISAEKMIAAMVGFDKWLEFQASSFDNKVMGPEGLAQAQEGLRSLKENGPDSPSNVRASFASDGVLLAYINADGTAVTTNAAAGRLQPILDKANELGLIGRERIDYLTGEFGRALSEDHSSLAVARYDAANTPSKRELALMWAPGSDVDGQYEAALTAAQDHLDSITAWHRQWQSNMDRIGTFLLGLQEAG